MFRLGEPQRAQLRGSFCVLGPQRVLEGKPTPVELKPVALHAVVESGARFQQARIVAGCSLQIECPDMWTCADQMKMTTLFMNLIGNALK